MKIAVTYDNGEVFQHFGHSQEFKVYDVQDGKVVSSEIVGAEGQGHGALAALLEGKGIDVLICGGIGGGAQAALAEQGIELCSGAAGDADKAVEAYLAGELENGGVNCNHHGEGHTCGSEEGGCGSNCGSDDGGCGSGCGGGCGGCHAKPSFDGKNVGKRVKAHYEGTFNDGKVFDSSYERGKPLEFVCGAGQMILGFDKAVATMEIGEIVNVHLMPNEAYGESDPDAIFTVEIAELPGSENLSVGEEAYLQDMYGRPIPVRIIAKDEKTITIDANHEMAGKELNFKIELVEVE
ncbi:MAG: FKBP-type peptidyl-prolyl cis-trans isomerase [Lachnospiraceae bacterium]|nr:FKBP-type peptidyl-prolyl cis-trans isomerase [Lachnospiraceae bacterium]